MATTSLQVVIDSQARLAGFTEASRAVDSLQSRVIRNQQVITAQAQRQQSVFATMAASFRKSSGMGGAVPMTLRGAVGAAGSWAGAAAGGLLAGAAFAVVNAFKEVVLRGMELADQLGDMAEQLGVSREDMMRIRQGAASAGVQQRTVMRSLSTLGQLRAAALGGDEEAKSIFSAYDISGGALEKAPSNLYLASLLRSKLGDEGPTTGDDAALRRMLGPQYRSMLTAIGKMPRQSPVLEETMAKADRYAAAKEYADSMRDVRSIEAAAQPWNPLRAIAADSATKYAFDLNEALNRMDEAVESVGERTAGQWKPKKWQPEGPKPEPVTPEATKRRQAAFDLNAESVGTPGSRRGLFASAADWRLWTSQLSVSKQQLDELKAIRAALSGGLQVDI